MLVDRRDFFIEQVPIYRADPVLFFNEVLIFQPDEWQAAAAIDLANNPKVSVRSGQGVGKTGLEAAVLLWFLTCFDYPRVVATAPTRQQLHDVLWSEVAKWQERSPLLQQILKWTKTYIYMKGLEKRWFAVARTATKPENMQGFHEDNMLFIVDEASGVADVIMEAIMGTLTGDNNKLLLCGNPTKASGTFHLSYTQDRDIFCCHRVNAEDSPRTNKENIKALERKYGRDSNVFRVLVLGDPPIAEDDIFIPLPLLEASVATEPSVDIKLDAEKRVLAVEGEVESVRVTCDVARYGDDRTVIGYRLNEVCKFHKKINGQDTMRTAADIVILCKQLRDKTGFAGKIPVLVDDGGVGGGVVDRLRQIKANSPAEYEWMVIFPVAFGQAIKHKYLADSTTLMMKILRDLLSTVDDDGNEKEVEIIIPDDNDLLAQLSMRKYSVNDRSKLVVESKKAMKARGLPSPDEGDCLLLMVLPVNMKGERSEKRNERRKQAAEAPNTGKHSKGGFHSGAGFKS